MTVETSKVHPSPRSKSPEAGEDDFVRLHITPLDANLLKIVVPSAVLPTARNISFHTIETFPEKRFGYVELPSMEAEKLKKKLNGATLKGSKMRIEKARPEKKRQPAEEDEPPKKKKTKRSSEHEDDPKQRQKSEVMDGMVLHERKVKRGWTEPLDYKKKMKKNDKDTKKREKDDKRTQTRSKYTEKEECLLKTKLPPNVASTLPKKEEDDSTKKRKKKKNSREVTVHEFENTTKFPSFLRESAPPTNGKTPVEFVEGKGWVDDDGNVVEEWKEKVRPKPVAKPKESKMVVEESSDDDTSSSGSSSESDSSSDASSDSSSDEEMVDASKALPHVESKPQTKATEDVSDDDTSSSESSSDTSSSSCDSDSDSKPSSTPAKGLTINIPPPPATPSTRAIHPLEALYKPSAANDASGSTSAVPAKQPFSFFGGDGDNDDIEDDDEDKEPPTSIAIPMTPYTRQDFEWRNVRSAAPTPDTAHPPRTQPLWASQDQDDEMEDEEIEEAYHGGAATPGQGTSDFQKWFWENRGDLNRSWMTRRKTAAKEKRHRDNKTRASKAV